MPLLSLQINYQISLVCKTRCGHRFYDRKGRGTKCSGGSPCRMRDNLNYRSEPEQRKEIDEAIAQGNVPAVISTNYSIG